MALPGYTRPQTSQADMELVARALRGWKPSSPYSSSPAQRSARRGYSSGQSVMNTQTQPEAYDNATPFGRRVWDSANNGKVYDHEWLAGQLAQNGGLGAPGAPSAGPTGPAGSGSPPTEGPPVPTEGPPEPPSAGSSSMLEQTDPAILQQILSLGDVDRQMALAEAMRDRESPEGRYVSNGRMYVAGSPLEHAATAFGKFRGKRQADKLGKEQIAGRMRILDILKGQ